MKKIMNDPSNGVPEMVAGLVSAYPTYLTQLPETTAVVRTDRTSMQGKVGLVSGGGSGHEPAHAGFVGSGMLRLLSVGKSLLHRHLIRSTKRSKLVILVLVSF